jgi:hypothetical protein
VTSTQDVEGQPVKSFCRSRGLTAVLTPAKKLLSSAIEEETGELEARGNSKAKRRKTDDEHLIREALLGTGVVDAVIAAQRLLGVTSAMSLAERLLN